MLKPQDTPEMALESSQTVSAHASALEPAVSRAARGVRSAASETDARRLRIVILGLSITSSWGNGHATTYRGLMRALCERGHDVLFLERDVRWYAEHRDLPEPPYGRTQLYTSLSELSLRFGHEIGRADLVIVGSYVPEGVALGQWVARHARGLTAFYDIDTPVTLAKLERGDHEYLSPALIRRYDLYLSFTGGPVLQALQERYGSPCARALYCAVDPSLYYPEPQTPRWDLGYMGTYSEDRQPVLERLMLEPARRLARHSFVVAGPQYPDTLRWPSNLQRIQHLAPAAHRAFYNAQRLTLNITRADMVRAGYSPSVRLFEAAACGTPILSDHWEGLDTLFALGEEILVTRSADETLQLLESLDEPARQRIAQRARTRVLSCHTAAHRAAQLIGYVAELFGASAASAGSKG